MDKDVTVTSMAGYAKLFSRILDSTVWREDNETRILWITMLAMADKHGNVLCTIPGLADRARISLKKCEAALDKFQKPDKYSWSREAEGRRIIPIDGGWFLINHSKYREMLSKDDQREKTRVRVNRWRERAKSVTGVTSYARNDIASTDTDATTKANTENLEHGTSFLFQSLGLGGLKHRVTCQDAVRAYSAKFKCDEKEAAEGLLASWKRYESIPGKYKTNKVGFLEKGVWENEESWTTKNSELSMGGW